MQVQPQIPIGERVYLDYGGFTTFNYISLDDSNDDNRTLGEYDLTLYAHLNVDGAHESSIRGRGYYRDFNDGDSFDRAVNGWDGHLELAAVYRFDLARSVAAYQGKQIDNNVVIKAGRDFVFWGNGLTLALDNRLCAGRAKPWTADAGTARRAYATRYARFRHLASKL